MADTAAPARAKKGADTSALFEKAQLLERTLKEPLVERDEEAFLIMLSLLARQHMAQIGGAGIAKSMLADRLANLIDGADIFSLQFFKGTEPQEVFGPVDLKALKDGRVARVVEGYLPTADIALLDEWWKANSMILNGCLGILNERKFKNDGQVLKSPLSVAVIASNELPEPGDAQLSAIRDRILLTKIVQGVRADQSRLDLIDGFLDRRAKGDQPVTPVMTLAELAEAQAQVGRIQVPPEVKANLITLWRSAETEGLNPSPRRFANGISILQAKAWLAGRKEVLADDLTIYQHMLWIDPEDISTAHAVTLDFASEFERKAARFRQELDDVGPAISQVREYLAADPIDFAAMTPVAAKAHSTLKGLMEKVKDQQTKAIDANRDTRALDDLMAEITSAREFIRQNALGMD